MVESGGHVDYRKETRGGREECDAAVMPGIVK